MRSPVSFLKNTSTSPELIDVDGVARLSVVENGLSRGEVDDIKLRGEFGALVIIKQLEKRDFLQQIGFRGHDREK